LSPLLLDAGVWLAAHDPDDRHHAAAWDLVSGPDILLAALDLTLYEVANICGVRWHDPELGQRLANAVTAGVGDRLVRCDSRLVATAIVLASDHHLTVYDAAYAAAAQGQGWQLVSGDDDLVNPGLAIPPEAA
jgi:predicted nucleic acid-binding protein